MKLKYERPRAVSCFDEHALRQQEEDKRITIALNVVEIV